MLIDILLQKTITACSYLFSFSCISFFLLTLLQGKDHIYSIPLQTYISLAIYMWHKIALTFVNHNNIYFLKVHEIFITPNTIP